MESVINALVASARYRAHPVNEVVLYRRFCKTVATVRLHFVALFCGGCWQAGVALHPPVPLRIVVDNVSARDACPPAPERRPFPQRP